MSSTSFKGPESVYLSLWLHITVRLVQEYVCSHFLQTNNFSLYLYIRCLPTFQMGVCLSGFSSHEFIYTQVLKCPAHQGAVRQAK